MYDFIKLLSLLLLLLITSCQPTWVAVDTTMPKKCKSSLQQATNLWYKEKNIKLDLVEINHLDALGYITGAITVVYEPTRRICDTKIGKTYWWIPKTRRKHIVLCVCELSLIAHEIGHGAGYRHVKDNPNNIMYPKIDINRTDYQF